MESLLLLGLRPDDISDKNLLMIREELAVLDYLAEKMVQKAPAEYLGNEEFKQVMNGVVSSLHNLRQAVNENNPGDILQSIKKLKPAYAKVFIKFC